MVTMGQVEAMAIVDAERKELFPYADWCYNLPEWFPAIRKARIVRLPDRGGLGKVTHYFGTLMGREMEWDAQSVEWAKDERFLMRAVRGMPAKMHMQFGVRFEDVEGHKTRVTGVMGYHASYPLIGSLIDRFYLRKEVRRLAHNAIEGIRRAAEQHKIPSLATQWERRMVDHPGYGIGGAPP